MYHLDKIEYAGSVLYKKYHIISAFAGRRLFNSALAYGTIRDFGFVISEGYMCVVCQGVVWVHGLWLW